MRGRPAGQMTHRRQQVLNAMIDWAAEGKITPKRQIARRLGLHDYSSLLRIEKDLRRIGALAI